MVAEPVASPACALRIRLLGDLEVMRDERPVPLPASKRTRALLGYLVATGVQQSRQALCDLLWDGPEDPRASLRWSLTKLRDVIDDDAATPRLVADREHVAFAAHGAAVDIVCVHEMLGSRLPLRTLPLQTLEQAAVLLRGELLDGLDLPTCYRFHHWCMAERERHGELRRAVLAALVERLAGDPQRALAYGRAMVAADPLAEAAHATLVRLLAASGRYPDAEAHYAYARDLLRREVAAPAGGPLDEAIRRVRRDVANGVQAVSAPGAAVMQAAPAVAAPGAAGDFGEQMVGRAAERLAIECAIRTADDVHGRLLLVVGEPGIGKTRLLDHFCDAAAAGGHTLIRGRCYEAEMVRPYGLWLDALRGIDSAGVPPDIVRAAAPLLGMCDDVGSGIGDRESLFDAAQTLLRSLAAMRPLAIALDDLQWLDEGSSALLHFLVRTLPPGARVAFAAAARVADIDDNRWAKGLLQSLAREQRLQRVDVGPLDAADVATLLGAPADAKVAREAMRRSGGNPLYLLELARAGEQSAAVGARSLDVLLGERLDAIDPAERELLAWAAAIGREVRPDLLADAAGVPAGELVARIERLERRGLMKPTADGHFDFVHDLLRQAVYRALSQPRRRAIHRQLARVLAAASAGEPRLAGELVHHASLAGDAPATARACVAAGEHCLRVFANAEAAAVAERGLAHIAALANGSERARLTIVLLKLRVVAVVRPGAARPPALIEQIEQAIAAADAIGLHAEAASGLHALSWLRQQSNDIDGVRAATLEAERLTRKADAATRCQQLANSGRCLLEVEADLPQARALLAQAAALADSLELKVIELLWGRGLIARADGDLDAAARDVASAVALARLRDDHWREYECLSWLATIAFERRDWGAVVRHGEAIVQVAKRMGDAGAPFAQALCALARLQRGGDGAHAELDAGLDALRAADDKAHLAYALNGTAWFEIDAGRCDAAQALASEACAAARAVQRSTEIVVATAALARIAATRGDARRAGALLEELARAGIRPSARAAAALERAERGRAAIPTLAPTPAR